MVKFYQPKRTTKNEKFTPRQETDVKEEPKKQQQRKKKFEKKDARISRILKDLSHKFQNINLMSLNYENDSVGSYFYDQLLTLNFGQSCPEWFHLYQKLEPLSLSLSLIILNKQKLFGLLLHFEKEFNFLRPEIFKLFFALLRDLKSECFDLVLQDVIAMIVRVVGEEESDQVVEECYFLLAGVLRFLYESIANNFPQFLRVYLKEILTKSVTKQNMRLFNEGLSYMLKTNKCTQKTLEMISETASTLSEIYQTQEVESQEKFNHFFSDFIFNALNNHIEVNYERNLTYFHTLLNLNSIFSSDFFKIYSVIFRRSFFKLLKKSFKSKPSSQLQSFPFQALLQMSCLETSQQKLFIALCLDFIVFKEGQKLSSQNCVSLLQKLNLCEVQENTVEVAALMFINKNIVWKELFQKPGTNFQGFSSFLEYIIDLKDIKSIYQIDSKLEEYTKFCTKSGMKLVEAQIVQIFNSGLNLLKEDDSLQIFWKLLSFAKENEISFKYSNEKLIQLLNKKKTKEETFYLITILNYLNMETDISNQPSSKNLRDLLRDQEQVVEYGHYFVFSQEFLFSKEITKIQRLFGSSREFSQDLLQSHIFLFLLRNHSINESDISCYLEAKKSSVLLEIDIEIMQELGKTRKIELPNYEVQMAICLMNRNQSQRKKALRFLTQSSDAKESELLLQLEEINQMEIGIDNERLVNIKLRNLQQSIAGDNISKEGKQLLFYFLMGFLFNRYNNIKKETTKLLSLLLEENEQLFVFFLNVVYALKQIKLFNENNSQNILNFMQYSQFLQELLTKSAKLVNTYSHLIFPLVFYFIDHKPFIPNLIVSKKMLGKELPLAVFMKEQAQQDLSLTGLERTDLKEIEFYYDILAEIKTSDKELKNKQQTIILSYMQFMRPQSLEKGVKLITNQIQSLIIKQEELLKMLDEKRFKEALINMNIQQLSLQTQKDFLPLFSSLFVSMFKDNRNKNKKFLASKQGFLITFLSNQSQNIIDKVLFDLFDNFLLEEGKSSEDYKKIFSILGIQRSKQIIKIIHLVIKNLVQKTPQVKFLSEFVTVGLREFMDHQKNSTNQHKKTYQKIIQNILETIILLNSNFWNMDLIDSQQLVNQLHHRFMKIDKTQNPYLLIKLMLIWSEQETKKDIFLKNGFLIEQSVKIFVKEQTEAKTIDHVTQLLMNLLENQYDTLQISPIGVEVLSRHLEFILSHLYDYLETQSKIFKKFIPSFKLQNFLIRIFESDMNFSSSSSDKMCDLMVNYLNSTKVNKYQSIIDRSPQGSEKHENFIEKIKKTILIISKFLQKKSNPDQFFYDFLLPFYNNITSVDLFLTLKNILEDIVKNSGFTLTSMRTYLIGFFELRKGMVLDFDTENLYERLKEFKISSLSSNLVELDIVLQITHRFLNFGDMSIRTLAYEIFEQFFEHFAENRLNSDLSLKLMEILDHILKVTLIKIDNHLISEDGFAYNLKLLSCYFGFVRLNQNQFSTEIKLKFADLLEIEQHNLFEDLVNLKFSVKIKALLKMEEIFEISHITNNSKQKVLIPVLQYSIENNYKKIKKETSTKTNTFQNFVTQASKVMKLLTQGMSLKNLCLFVKRYVSLLRSNSDRSFYVYKIIYSTLGNLSQYQNLVDSVQILEKEFKRHLNYKGDSYKMEQTVEKPKQKMEIEEESLNGQINTFLRPTLNYLKGKLFSKKDSDPQTQITLSSIILIIIRYFPSQQFRSELKKMVAVIINLLKNKDKILKRKAYGALVYIGKQLGPFLLDIIIKEILYHLSEGMQRHTRNYAVWYLLNELILPTEEKQSFPFVEGQIDHFLMDVAQCATQECFSEMFSEKDLQDIKKKSKEVKIHRANQLMFKIGQTVGDKKTVIYKTIELIKEGISNSKDIKLAINNSNDLLNGLIAGMIQNRAMKESNVFSFGYLLIRENKEFLPYNNQKQKPKIDNEIEIEENTTPSELKRTQKKVNIKIQKGASTGEIVQRFTSDNITTKQNIISKILARFSLKLIGDWVRNRDDYCSQIQEDLVDSKVNLQNCFEQIIGLMNCNYEEISFQALRDINTLVEKKYPICIESQEFFDNLLQILSKLGMRQLDLINVVFSLLIKILQKNSPKMKHLQYEILFFSLEEYLTCSDAVQNPISFLEVLIDKRFVQPQVYDMIDKSFDKFFQLKNTFFREVIQRIISKFVSTFPINKEFLVQIMTTLMKNIQIQDQFTRKQVIVFIYEIFQKYDLSFFEEFSDVYFLNILTARVNEQETDIQREIELLMTTILKTSIKDSVNAFKSPFVQRIFQYSQKFIGSPKQNISCSGILIISLLLNIDPENTLKKLNQNDILGTISQEFSQIEFEIVEFKKKLKDNAELQSKYQNSPWKEFLLETQDNQEMQNELFSKNQYVFSLLNVFVSNWNEQLVRSLGMEYIFDNISKLFNHPASDVQLVIVDLFDKMLQFKKEILSNDAFLKEIFVHLLNSMKKKYFQFEDSNYIQTIHNYLQLSIENELEYFDLSMTVLVNLARITTSKISFNQIIIERVLQLLERVIKSNSDDCLKNENFIKIIVIYGENKSVLELEDLQEEIQMLQKRVLKSREGKDLYFKIKQDILKKRLENKNQKTQLAITNPQDFAKMKQQKNEKTKQSMKKRKKKMFLEGRKQLIAQIYLKQQMTKKQILFSSMINSEQQRSFFSQILQLLQVDKNQALSLYIDQHSLVFRLNDGGNGNEIQIEFKQNYYFFKTLNNNFEQSSCFQIENNEMNRKLFKTFSQRGNSGCHFVIYKKLVHFNFPNKDQELFFMQIHQNQRGCKIDMESEIHPKVFDLISQQEGTQKVILIMNDENLEHFSQLSNSQSLYIEFKERMQISDDRNKKKFIDYSDLKYVDNPNLSQLSNSQQSSYGLVFENCLLQLLSHSIKFCINKEVKMLHYLQKDTKIAFHIEDNNLQVKLIFEEKSFECPSSNVKRQITPMHQIDANKVNSYASFEKSQPSFKKDLSLTQQLEDVFANFQLRMNLNFQQLQLGFYSCLSKTNS